MNQRSPYVFEHTGSFVFAAPIDAVWNVLERFDSIASTWPWLHDVRIEGEGLQRGTVVRGVVAPPLPYRMRLDVVLEDDVPRQRVIASVHGDLEGSAEITFDDLGVETQANAHWTIEMMQPPMRLAARVAPRLLRWGHDRVVAVTVAGLCRQLSDERA